MTDKSYVTLEQHVCPVCGTTHDTGALLLDTRMRNRFDKHTATGYAPCPPCKSKLDEGYIALVAARTPPAGETMQLDEAYRTGPVAWVRESVWPRIFNVPVPPMKMAFVEQEVIDALNVAAPHSEGE